MAKRSPVYTILDIPPGSYYRHREGLIGLEAALIGGQSLYEGARYYAIRLTLQSAKKLTEWCKSKSLVRPFYRTGALFCILGKPDTPELLAYDEIDQQEEPKLTRRLRSSRSRQQTSSECSGKELTSCSQCSSKPKRSRSRRQPSQGR